MPTPLFQNIMGTAAEITPHLNLLAAMVYALRIATYLKTIITYDKHRVEAMDFLSSE